ncbi:MAG: TfpX/TfpZ family type IV pilin accessory protein [Pseudomonadota bacterium]
MPTSANPWKLRFSAAGVHLCISLVLAVFAALLVFMVWYPYPYREISGGRTLFLLIVTVDVIMGPLLTFAVFDVRKPRTELVRDLAVIGVLQLAALGYGLWTVAAARPVHLVFEMDRFRVVHAIEVAPSLLEKAAPEFRDFPLFGPTLLSVRPFRDAKESMDATLAALQGVSIGSRPDLWQSYEKARAQILAKAKPLAELKARFPARSAEIDAAVKSSVPVRANGNVVYVPMMGRDTLWTALLDTNTLEVIAFVPIDSF